MNNLLEKSNRANRSALEAVKTIVNASLEGIGELTALNLQTLRAITERSVENLGTLSEVRDLQGLVAMHKPLAVSAVEESIAYSRRVYEVCSESSTTVLRVVEGQIGELGGAWVAVFEKTRKQVPPVVKLVVAGAKSLLSMASQATDQVGRATSAGRYDGTADAVATRDAAANLPETTG